MIKKILIIGCLTLTVTASANCQLPKDESITVGCSYQCDFFYRFRLMTTSWALGYKTNIINLQNQPDLKTALAQVDGVLMPGGADIDPKYYMNDITPELRSYTEANLHLVNFTREGEYRDPFEYSLIKLYSNDDEYKDLPLLGICRGLQMMSVGQGIPLYLDIQTELGIKNRRNRFDIVQRTTDDSSLMKKIYRKEFFRAFKIHHQGIRVPYYEKHQDRYPNTRLTSFSHKNRIAESIEYTHRPALGVQYHPERSFSGTSAPVFRWFLTKACEYKTSHRKEGL